MCSFGVAAFDRGSSGLAKVAHSTWHWRRPLATLVQLVRQASFGHQTCEEKLWDLAPVDQEYPPEDRNLLVGQLLLQLPWLPPASVTCTVDACQACSLAVHSSFAGDAAGGVGHLGHSLATEVSARSAGTASAAVSGMLLKGCPQRGFVVHHSSADAREHAHVGGAAGIARSRSSCGFGSIRYLEVQRQVQCA